MKLKVLPHKLSVCKLKNIDSFRSYNGFFFLSRTDEEISLVCESDYVPDDTIAREDGWRGFRIQGELDFSLIGILAPIAQLLAEEKIGIFAVSTYNTDYILVKEKCLETAKKTLTNAGYKFI